MGKNNSKKSASSLLYIIIFLTTFFIFSAFAVDGTIVLTNRVKLQNAVEMAALSGASEMTYDINASSSDIQNAAQIAAKNTFKLLQYGGLESVDINNPSFFNVTADTTSNKVSITANMIAQPYFLAFFGVDGINVAAKATAVNEPLEVTANYTGIDWLTTNAAYLSDILSKDLNMNDTAILLPLGDFKSASYDNTSGFVNFKLIEQADNKPLSLGPSGFITIKLPAPIVDKPGYDLYIKEAGTIEGYMVFAGLDKNPDKPYVQHDKPGDGISWVNISCAGKPDPVDSSGKLGTYTVSTDNLGTQNRFFGSGYFDIGNSCVGNISMAKYIRIIDDNDESGFVKNNASFYKAKLYGEASSATAGADIDEVKVLNHVRLVAN